MTAAALLGAGLTASLGQWQVGRAAQKEALAARIDARAQEPVIDAEGWRWQDEQLGLYYRRIAATGQWIAEHTIFLDNRQMKGRPGLYVLTPLRLTGSGTVIMVQRGWVARDFQDRLRLPRVETPTGEVRVQGLLVPPPSKLYEFDSAGATGAIRQNLDIAAFRQETGLALLPVSIQELGAASDGLARDWPRINTGVDKHYGYAFQWFGLSALITILYVWFQLIQRYRRRRR